MRGRHLLGSMVAAGLVLAGTGAPAGGTEHEANASGSPPPVVTYVRARPAGKRRILVGVRARDPDATVTEIEIDWGDGRGVVATNGCRAFTDGTDGPHTGKTIAFRRIPHRYPRRGRFTLRVTAVSHLCPEHTNVQVGAPVTRTVRVER